LIEKFEEGVVFGLDKIHKKIVLASGIYFTIRKLK